MSGLPRRGLILALAGQASVVAGQVAAWPERTVRILAGFQAGGTADVLARVMADRLGPRLGATLVVENRPGASGVLAADAARMTTDRHTLLVVSDSTVTAPLVNRNARYNLASDFEPVAVFAEGTHVEVASAASPFRSLAALVDAARSSPPGSLIYVTSGVGHPQHLIAEAIAGAAGVEFTHVPTRGGG